MTHIATSEIKVMVDWTLVTFRQQISS